jgi:hypothetical protein
LATTRLGRWLLQYAETRQRKRLIQAWQAAGCSVPPPHEYKQKVVAEYAKRFKLKTLVETGTYLGDMVWASRNVFDDIVSIELSADLWKAAKKRMSPFEHVQILHGDSTSVLPEVIARLRRPALFWLDGHYSGGRTALGLFSTPICAEIQSIGRSDTRGHVVLVDDARHFTGDHDYPSLNDLATLVHNSLDSVAINVKHDIIRITPEPISLPRRHDQA